MGVGYPKGRKRGKQSIDHIKKRSDAMKISGGHVQSIETRKKISNIFKGANSPLWRGGVSNDNLLIRKGIEIRLWRESVFARDGWTCQKTKVKGGILEAHHLINFSNHPELRFAIDNGITLSKSAHRMFHTIYGKMNNTNEQMNEYLRRKEK